MGDPTEGIRRVLVEAVNVTADSERAKMEASAWEGVEHG